MKKKKIALLDLGGVVFQSAGRSNDLINWDTIWILNQKYGAEMDLGKRAFPDFLLEYNSLTRQNLNADKFLKYLYDTLDFNQELIDLIGKDRDIIIVSDNYKENIQYISNRYDFAGWSIKQIYSFDYKMYKSNPQFFKRLLKEIKQYHVNELIFIDDSKSKLESAAINGINGILYQTNEQLINELME